MPCGATLGVAEALGLTATSQAMGTVTDVDSIDITPVDVDSGGGGGGAGTGGYFFANSLAFCAGTMPTFSWIDISGTGTDVVGMLADDNFIGPFPIGFTFTYFGADYTEFLHQLERLDQLRQRGPGRPREPQQCGPPGCRRAQ